MWIKQFVIFGALGRDASRRAGTSAGTDSRIEEGFGTATAVWGWREEVQPPPPESNGCFSAGFIIMSFTGSAALLPSRTSRVTFRFTVRFVEVFSRSRWLSLACEEFAIEKSCPGVVKSLAPRFLQLACQIHLLV